MRRAHEADQTQEKKAWPAPLLGGRPRWRGIASRGAVRARGPARARMRPVLVAVAGLTALSLTVAACSVGSSGVAPARGPKMTLRLALYGAPAYQAAGLFSAYQTLHPGTTVVSTDAKTEQSYWQGIQKQLASGHSKDDLIAIPIDDMAAAVNRYGSDLVPLSTLGGTSPGVNTFEDQWMPWLWQPASQGGQDYAVGAETGPLAMCYRPTLLHEAGLPTSPSQLARTWSTWQGYLAFGREFKQRVSHGPAFTDSATSMFNAMVSQSGKQFYTAQGKLAVNGNPALKTAWHTAVSAARDGLTAKLTQLSPAWNAGVTRLSFATAICPAWMLSSIAKLTGPHSGGAWSIAPIPGGTGNLGGFYLAIPRSSAHQAAAFDLATYLTAQQTGSALVQAGVFPASMPAINSAVDLTDSYFGGAAVGRIFGVAANRMPAAPTGPAAAAIGAGFDSALASVVSSGAAPSAAWAHAEQAATAAYHAARASG